MTLRDIFGPAIFLRLERQRSVEHDRSVLLRREQHQQLTRERLSSAGRRGMWRRWRREAMIMQEMPMVERVAREVRHMFARHLDIRDLVQAGNLGLVKAAKSYHPSKGDFEPYAYFVVRGAIIDSQKRRTYREEANESLQAISGAHDGWLPPALDTCPRPLPDEQAERSQIEQRLAAAIAELPEMERRVLLAHLDGQALTATARELDRSVNWARAKLAEAREMVGLKVRGK